MVDLYKPALPAPVVTGVATRSLLTTFLTALVAPEAALPTVFANFLVAATQPENIALFLAMAANFTDIVKNSLEIVKLLKETNLIDDPNGKLDSFLEALYCEDENGDKLGLACWLKKIAQYEVQEGVHAGEVVTLPQSAYNIYTTLYFKLSDGTYIPLTDALTRLTLSGVTRNYMTIPLGGEGGG